MLRALPENPKGDPLEVARVAGISAAKRTWDLIPMCHPLELDAIEVERVLGVEPALPREELHEVAEHVPKPVRWTVGKLVREPVVAVAHR
mgnify:CR=1 FL=1